MYILFSTLGEWTFCWGHLATGDAAKAPAGDINLSETPGIIYGRMVLPALLTFVMLVQPSQVVQQCYGGACADAGGHPPDRIAEAFDFCTKHAAHLNEGISVSECARVVAEHGIPGAASGNVPPHVQREIEGIAAQAFADPHGPNVLSLWRRVLQLNPRDTVALVQSGIRLVDSTIDSDKSEGTAYLERAFEPSSTPYPLDGTSVQGYTIAQLLGRRDNTPYAKQMKFLTIAADSPHSPDDCHVIQKATLIPEFPESIEEARNALDGFHSRMDALLAREHISVAKTVVDPYVHCFFSPFYHSLYYEKNPRLATEKHFRLAQKIMPYLLYLSPHLDVRPSVSPKRRRTKVGFVCTYFRAGHSVFDAFGPTVARLPRDVFDVSLIAVEDNRLHFDLPFLDEQARVDTVVRVGKEDGWIHSARRDIAKLDVDLLVFLDHSMTDRIHTLALSRLAPVQAVTFGHPVSTGMPRSIQDYYISWENFELPLPQSQEFYSEELVLLPGNVMHSYVEPRTRDGASAVTGHLFSRITRQDFVDNNIVPHSARDGRWYTCMHTSYKRHPAFDAIIVQILQRDPSAHIMLLKEPTENQQVAVRRFTTVHADMARIHFLSSLTHHVLMGLYSLVDVVLDSVFAGGTTTSREVLEVGGPIVTLPSHLHGSRCTLSYYKLMGGFDELVANSPAECALPLCPCEPLAPSRGLRGGP